MRTCIVGGGMLGLEAPSEGAIDGSALAAAGGAQAKHSILDAIRSRVGENGNVRYARGCGILDGDDAGIREAVAVASGADVASGRSRSTWFSTECRGARSGERAITCVYIQERPAIE